MSKKDVTLTTIVESIEDLAAMTARGFKEVGNRIDSLETRLDDRIDGLEARLDARIDGVESKLGALHSEVLSMNYDHKKIKARLENVEVRVFGSIQEA